MENESWESAAPPTALREAAGAGIDLKKAKRRKQNYSEVDLQRADRLPPHAPEAEQGILGCCLLSPMQSIGDCIQMQLDSDDFYDLRHQTIWLNLVLMYNERVPIDIITLQQRMKDWGTLDEIGGIPYLNVLQDSVPSAANLSYYVSIVKEKSTLRKVLNTCTDAIGRVYNYAGEVDQFVDEVERDILKISEVRQSGEAVRIGELVGATDSVIESYANNRGSPGAIPTGFPDLDRLMLGGLKGGEMFVLAARPSVGKTSYALNIAENIALNSRLPVGVFSLEMTKEALTLRMRCANARVGLRTVMDGQATQEDFTKLTEAAYRLGQAPIYIDDTPSLSIMALRAKARRMVQRFGIKAFVVDYLQLCVSTTKRAKENRQIEISEISSGIKALAKELNLPIVVLAQLNRDIEKEKKRKPRLSDLRESGSIEQDADVVGLLYNANADKEDGDGQVADTVIPVNLLIAKQRNGPTGMVYLTFFKSYTQFESATRVADADVPQNRSEPEPEPEQTEMI